MNDPRPEALDEFPSDPGQIFTTMTPEELARLANAIASGVSPHAAVEKLIAIVEAGLRKIRRGFRVPRSSRHWRRCCFLQRRSTKRRDALHGSEDFYEP